MKTSENIVKLSPIKTLLNKILETRKDLQSIRKVYLNIHFRFFYYVFLEAAQKRAVFFHYHTVSS